MDHNYDKILEKLKEIHDEFPDLKFGYVVQSALDKGKIWKNCDLHDHSSKHMLLALNEFHRHVGYLKASKGKGFLKVKKNYLAKLAKVKGVGLKKAYKLMKDFDSEETLINVLHPREIPLDEDLKTELRKHFKRKEE